MCGINITYEVLTSRALLCLKYGEKYIIKKMLTLGTVYYIYAKINFCS